MTTDNDFRIGDKMVEDMRRQFVTERKLKEGKRPWFLRRYLKRNLAQWLCLYAGLLIIILVLNNPTWSMVDLFMMVLAGLNIDLWIMGARMNLLTDMVQESLETMIYMLKSLENMIENEE